MHQGAELSNKTIKTRCLLPVVDSFSTRHKISRTRLAQTHAFLPSRPLVRPSVTNHAFPLSLSLVPQDGKSLQLTVGYHQLEGKKVPLKKPLAILSKVQRNSDQADAEQQQQPSQPVQPQGSNPDAMDASHPQGAKHTAYEVRGRARPCVRHRLAGL